MLPDPREARYSGSDLPAWRMNHNGTIEAGSPLQTRKNAESRNNTSRSDTESGAGI